MKNNDPYEMPGKPPKVPDFVMTILFPVLYPFGKIMGKLKELEGKRKKK